MPEPKPTPESDREAALSDKVVKFPSKYTLALLSLADQDAIDGNHDREWQEK